MIYLAGTDFSHLTSDELIKGIKALDLPDYIRSKAYGIDVRETLAQMTEMTIQLGINMGLSPDEALKWARKLQESVSQSEFDSWVATLLDGGPSLFFETKAALVAKYPNGAPGVALVRETDPAKIYVWNGTSWEDFGDYQGIEVKEGSIVTSKLADKAVTAERTNFFDDMVKLEIEGVLLNTTVRLELVDGFNRNNGLSRIANHRTAIVKVSGGETLYLERGYHEWMGRLTFLTEYPKSLPHAGFEGSTKEVGNTPKYVKVPDNAKYLAWTVSNDATVPTFNIYRKKIKNELVYEPDIYEWSENLFKNQYVIGEYISPEGVLLANYSYVTVRFPVREGEVYKIWKDSGTPNRLGFIGGHYAKNKKSIVPVIEPRFDNEIVVPKGANWLIWNVRDDRYVPKIRIQKKVIKEIYTEINSSPEVSELNTSFSGILEHEWRSAKNHVYVSPKVFVIDGHRNIYSTTDYGQTYKQETTLDYRPRIQYSNMGHRMLFQSATNGNRDGVVRIYTDDYQLISEHEGIWPGYNENGADGRPGFDGEWIFGEYVAEPAGGHLGLGVRVMQTKDNGLTWNEILHLDDVTHIHSCRYDPYNPNHIYVNTGDATTEMRNRWYASYDNGATWEHLSGGVLNGGQTPLTDGTFASDKYMRTTALVMGVDSGEKGRNSIFYIHDNGPTSLVRFDKKAKKFQLITGDLEGVAYCTTLTENGMYTIVQTSGEHDVLHYILFPENDDDIDKPEKYKVFSIKLPKNGYKAMLLSSRQIDLAGNSVIGANKSYYEKMGRNLTNNENGKSIGLKINFGWSNDENGELKLTVITRPIMPIY